MNIPEISVILPIYNEQYNLPELFRRLTNTLDDFGKTYELIFTNDGSQDESLEILNDFHRKRPFIVTVIDFNRNYGQHMAVLAGLKQARGEIAVTLDADLQNPPEEIPNLISKIYEGHDMVGSYRTSRQDTFGRRYGSRLMNKIRARITNIKMTDQGCMLRAYRRELYTTVIQSKENSLYIPALAYRCAANPTEIKVSHAERANGKSNYSYFKLMRLNFDLVTGYSLLPLQLFTVFGIVSTGLSSLALISMVVINFLTAFSMPTIYLLLLSLFLLISIGISGMGLIGEYMGRVFQRMQDHPQYVTKSIQLPEEDFVSFKQNIL